MVRARDHFGALREALSLHPPELTLAQGSLAVEQNPLGVLVQGGLP